MNQPQQQLPRHSKWICTGLLVAPVVLHLGLLMWSTGRLTLPRGRTDLGIWGILGVYLVIGAALKFRPRWQLRYVVCCWSLLLAAVAAEVLLTVLMPPRAYGVPCLPVKTTVLQPATGPGIQGPVHFTVSSLGLRGPKRTAFDQADVRILCVGGSTTECLHVSDEKTWPWRLQKNLQKRTGNPIYVGNAGRSGQFTLHHAWQIQNFHLVDEFDHVIILCGFNDMLRLLRDSYESSRLRVPSEALSGEPKDAAWYRHLNLLTLAQWFVRQHIRPTGVVQDSRGEFYDVKRRERTDQIRQQGFSRIPDDVPAALQRYRTDVKQRIAACRSRGVTPVFLTQPAIYRPDLTPEEDRLLWLTFARPGELSALLGKYNNTLRQVCEEERVTCLDLASRIPSDTTAFYDDCHFNDLGCEQVAAFVTEYYSDVLRNR